MLSERGDECKKMTDFLVLRIRFKIKLVYERAEVIEKEKHDYGTKKKLKKTLKLVNFLFRSEIIAIKKREEKEKENEKDPLAIFKFNLNENFDDKSKRVKEKVRLFQKPEEGQRS